MHTHTSQLTATLRLLAGLSAAFVFAAAVSRAQTSVPTPQSVAPAYTPPVEQTYPQYGGNPAYAYVPTRAGTWDFYFNVGYAFYDESTFSNTTIYDPFLELSRVGNMKFKLDDDFSFGFGFNYNINDKLAVGAEFSYSQPSYDASFTTAALPAGEGEGPGTVTYTITGDASIYSGNAFVQYNFANKSKITPYIRASVGFAWIDTGIPTGPTQYYWWWDWWWGGYYVVGSTPTKSDTYLTLGATGGLRFDFGNHVYGTVAYDASWVDTSRDWTLAQRVSISIGWNY